MGLSRTIAAFLAIAVSTPKRNGRAETQVQFGRYKKLLWIGGILIWAAIIFGGIFPGDA